MNRLFDLSGWACRVLAGVCCVLLAGVAIVTFVDVCLRELGFDSIVGRTAAAEWTLLYVACLGAPYLVRESGHIFVDALLQALPRRARTVLEKLIYLLCIVLCLYLGGYAVMLGYEGWVSGDYEVRSFDMPRWAIYLPMVIGFFLMVPEFLRYLLTDQSMYSRSAADQDAAL